MIPIGRFNRKIVDVFIAKGVYMNRARGARGVALFRVDKDVDLTLLDLELIGLYLIRSPFRGKHYRLLRALKELEDIKPELKDLTYNLSLMQYKAVILVCKFYYDRLSEDIIKYVAFVSQNPGILTRVSKELVKIGWKREFILDIVPVKRRKLTGRFRY
ncbi:MAG: hypothetical protein DRJ32_03730 [Thermoprotei archaeon]|nr:MAG: hypothetical protein DRJ32_03730 [Thermoprotei archaeon]